MGLRLPADGAVGVRPVKLLVQLVNKLVESILRNACRFHVRKRHFQEDYPDRRMGVSHEHEGLGEGQILPHCVVSRLLDLDLSPGTDMCDGTAIPGLPDMRPPVLADMRVGSPIGVGLPIDPRASLLTVRTLLLTLIRHGLLLLLVASLLRRGRTE